MPNDNITEKATAFNDISLKKSEITLLESK